MFEGFSQAFIQELQEIKRSYYKLFLITLFPLLCFGLVIAIFYKGVAYEMPVVVVDNDNSKLSRKLLFNINASPTIDIVAQKTDTHAAMKLLHSSQVYAVLEIPKHFAKDVYLKKQPSLNVMLNTQYILIGKILKAALLESVSSSAAEVEFVNNLTQTKNPKSALGMVAPVQLYVVAFFNQYKNYFYFLVSALLPSIWQIFIVIATIVSFGSTFKEKKEKKFFGTQHIGAKIVGKMFPYTIAYMILGVGYLFYIYGCKGWYFEGSFLFMVFAMFVTVIAYQGVALLFFISGFDYARTLSLGAVYTAPAFAFLGVTFPIYNMNEFALFWRDMLPVSYLMEIQISQANYGAPLGSELHKIVALLIFWLVFIPVVWRIKQRLQR